VVTNLRPANSLRHLTKDSMIEVLARAVEVRRVDGTTREAIVAASTACGE
jgi:hypothetical protein